MRLSLGPVLYYWPRQTLDDFYQNMADAPVDILYLGETVCSKRRSFSASEWIELAQQLAANTDKEIVLSTLALIEAGSELGGVKRLCRNGELLVEANEMGAVQLMSEQKLPFVAGPALNIYNAYTLKKLASLGLKRWVMPVELSRSTLSDILRDVAEFGLSDTLETEVFSFGKMPLAYSARCFTARHHKLPKDGCQFKCLDYPQGLALDSQEGEQFLNINGIQTQSGAVTHLLPYWQDMQDLGVSIMRISPESPVDTAQVLAGYHRVISGESTDTALDKQLATLSCDGYWCGEAGMKMLAKGG